MALALNGRRIDQMVINGRQIDTAYINGRRVFPDIIGPLDSLKRLKWEFIQNLTMYKNGIGNFITLNKSGTGNWYDWRKHRWEPMNYFAIPVTLADKSICQNNGTFIFRQRTSIHNPYLYEPDTFDYLHISKDGKSWYKFPQPLESHNSAEYGSTLSTAACNGFLVVAPLTAYTLNPPTTKFYGLFVLDDYTTNKNFTKYNLPISKNEQDIVYANDQFIWLAYDKILASDDAKSWRHVAVYDGRHHFDEIDVVNGVCFISTFRYEGQMYLYILERDYSLRRILVSSWFCDAYNIVYNEKTRAYMLFSSDNWYGTFDLINWDIIKCPLDITSPKGCFYVSGDGYYLNVDGGLMYGH